MKFLVFSKRLNGVKSPISGVRRMNAYLKQNQRSSQTRRSVSKNQAWRNSTTLLKHKVSLFVNYECLFLINWTSIKTAGSAIIINLLKKVSKNLVFCFSFIWFLFRFESFKNNLQANLVFQERKIWYNVAHANWILRHKI